MSRSNDSRIITTSIPNLDAKITISQRNVSGYLVYHHTGQPIDYPENIRKRTKYQGPEAIEISITRLIYRLEEDYKKTHPTRAYDRADLEFVYEFILPGAMRLILNWTGEDDRLSPEELGWRLDRLGHYCHLAIREFHK